MRKKKVILLLILLPLLIVGSVVGYAHFFPDEFYQGVYQTIQGLALKRPTDLKVGQSYLIDDRLLKFVDEERFFYYMDYTDFENERDLDDYRQEMEDESIVPYLVVVEGNYTRKGSSMFIQETKGVLLTFETVRDSEKKRYSSLEELTYIETGYEKEPQFVKKEKGYYFNQNLYLLISKNSFEKIGQLASFPVYESDEKLPNSVDEFLSSYQKKGDK